MEVCFRAKVRRVYNMDDTLAYEYVTVPKLDRCHCDMRKFGDSRKFGPYSNSDLFPAMLRRAVSHVGDKIRLNAIPPGVSVDTSGFLAAVTITIEEA